MEFKIEWSGDTTELLEGLETTAGELKKLLPTILLVA
jgi:hypothetical protein